MGNFTEAYPDVEVRTATFESNDEAAAKIKAGFRADVIEVCLDEQGPLVEAGMLAPIDTSRLENWDDLDPTFRDAAGVASGESGDVTMVPTQAGAVGLIYDKDEFPDGVDSWADLFDPEYAGRVAMDGGYWLTPFAIMALANGSTDPMTMDDDEVAELRDAADRPARRRALPGLRPFGRRHGQHVQVRRDRHLRRRAGDVAGHHQGWRQRRLGRPRGRRAVVGVRPEHQLGRREPRRGVRLHQRPHLAARPRPLFGNNGFVMINPKAVPLVDEEFVESSDPTILEGAHAEVAPENADTWREYWQEVRAG